MHYESFLLFQEIPFASNFKALKEIITLGMKMPTTCEHSWKNVKNSTDKNEKIAQKQKFEICLKIA